MRVAILTACALVACKHERDRAEPPPPAPIASGSAKAGADPWAVGPELDAPPSDAYRHKLADEACPKVDKAYFWAVAKGHHTSYILGERSTDVPLAKLPPIVTQKLRAARVIVLETSPQDRDLPKYPDVDLPRELGPELWTKFERIVSKRGALTVAHTRPVFAIIAAYVLYRDYTHVFENELVGEATAAHVPIRALETARVQRDLLERIIDMRALRTWLEHTNDRAELEKEARDSLAKYCAGTLDDPSFDPETMAKLRDGGYSEAEIDAMTDQLIYRRTASWLPQIDELLAQGDAFVSVTFGHLLGPRGLPAELARRGYKVTRIER